MRGKHGCVGPIVSRSKSLSAKVRPSFPFHPRLEFGGVRKHSVRLIHHEEQGLSLDREIQKSNQEGPNEGTPWNSAALP